MAYTTGLDFTIPNEYTTGLDFVFQDNNSSQLSSGTITLIGSVLQSEGSLEDNSSQLSYGTFGLIGQVLTSSAPEHNDSNLSNGVISLVANTLRSAVANLLGVDAYTVTIKGTQDLYYLSDSMSGFAVDYYPYHESDIAKDLTGLVLSVNNSRATHTHSILGSSIIDLSYLQDYYYRIHLSVINLDLGNVTSEQIFYVEVWNAWFTNDTLSSLINYQLNDLTLTLPFTVPYAFKPLQNEIIQINVSPNGTPIIDGSYTFIFSTETVVLYVTGRRVVLWPFAPTTTFQETRSWITDILGTRNSETRYAMRQTPRTTVDYKFNFKTSEAFALATSMAKDLTNLALGIPVWSDVTYVTGITAGDTVISIDTTNLELKIGTIIVLWKSYKIYELGTVASLTSTSITLVQALANSFSSCWVIPVLIGYTSGDITFSQNENFGRAGSLKLEATDTFYSEAWNDIILFQGLPVLTVQPVVSGGLTIKYNRQQKKLDSITGNYGMYDDESYNRMENTISFSALTLKERYILRRFFDYLKGKFSSFWLPSFTDDIIAISNIPLGSNSLHVVNTSLSLYPPKYIRVIGENTQIFEVSSVTDNLDGTAYISLTTTASPAINTIRQIEVVAKVRLNSDNIDFAHKGKNVTFVRAPVLEIKS